MLPILSRKGRAIVERFARRRLLLALDYDGTLAPIARAPGRAAMTAGTHALLGQVARLYPSAIISGRGQADARRRLVAAGVAEVVGNHGIGPGIDARDHERFASRARAWASTLRRRLASVPGVEVEGKEVSVSIHYRRSRDRRSARAAIRRALADLTGARQVGGKLVVNLLPRGAPDKGLALGRLRRRLRCDAALYVGDDETDEAVFRRRDRNLLGVRVGRRRGSAARHYLRNRREVDTLLRLLIALRLSPAAPDQNRRDQQPAARAG